MLDELCVYVKTEMKMRGFVSRSFHELPNDMSHGSRELLLAFGWLMCRSGLIELFMEQCCTFLDGMEVVGDLDKLSLPVSNIFYYILHFQLETHKLRFIVYSLSQLFCVYTCLW